MKKKCQTSNTLDTIENIKRQVFQIILTFPIITAFPIRPTCYTWSTDSQRRKVALTKRPYWDEVMKNADKKLMVV